MTNQIQNLMLFLQNIDNAITVATYNLLPHNPFFDAFFSFFSLKGVYIFGWFLLIIGIIVFNEMKNPGTQKKNKLFIFYLILSLAITWLFVFGLKNIVQRDRPCGRPNFNQFQLIPTNCPSDFSFPSGHASSSFAAATIVGFLDKKRRFLYFAISVLISLSRIYLGVHYFFDTLFGTLIGYLVSIFILKLKDYLPKRIFSSQPH